MDNGKFGIFFIKKFPLYLRLNPMSSCHQHELLVMPNFHKLKYQIQDKPDDLIRSMNQRPD